MRLVVLLILLFTIPLYAEKNKDLCYSIQIGSFYNSTFEDIKKLSFPKECKIVKKAKAYAIVCECDTEANIRKKLPFYKKNVPDAFLTKTKIEHSLNAPAKKDVVLKTEKKSETLNELMYKVFIYNSDLKNAQKVARKALKQNPKDLKWRKYLADALSWSGRSEEAFKHYIYIYNVDKERKTLKHSSKRYGSYDKYFMLLGKIFSNPKDENSIEQFIKEAEKLGNSKEAISALDKLYFKTKSAIALKKSAKLCYRLGMKKEAIARFKVLEREKLLDIETAMILSRIFFEQKSFNRSLQALLSVEYLAKRQNKEYWYLLSDIYSYLKKDDKAAKVLRALCIKSECRKYDYDKLISYYIEKDREFALEISLKAFNELREKSYFFSFAQINLELKKPNKIIKIINSLNKKEEKAYKKLPLFWLIVASVNDQLGFVDKTLFSYQKALSLDPKSTEILSQYSWFLMAKNRSIELQNIIKTIQMRAKEDKKLYILAAAINYKLNKREKARQYYLMALNNEPDNIDLNLDYANLLIILGDKAQADKITKNIYNKLQAQMKKEPKLLKVKQFLKHYLRASIYFIPYSNYKELMKHARRTLDKESYINFNIAWKLYTSDSDYVLYLSKKLKEPELWLQTYLTIQSNDTYAMRELLYRYGTILPLEDKISINLKTKQIAMARKNIFEGLEETPQNKSLYRTKYEIDTKYGNRLNSEIGYENQGDLKRTYVKIDNLHHFTGRYYVGSSLHYGENRSNSYDIADDNKTNSTAKLWLKMLMNNGYIEAGGGFRDNYPQYFFNLHNNLTNKLSIKLELEKNKLATETINLRLNGKKDYASIGAKYQFNNRFSFEAEASNSNYKLHEGDSLGSGSRYYFQTQQKIKFSYPDILFREYISIANFRDKGIENLPQNYLQGGIGMQIGMSALNRYSGSLKPYLDISTAYHNHFGLSFAGELGISGKFIGSDYLNLSLNYNRLASTNDELWLLKLNHSYLY